MALATLFSDAFTRADSTDIGASYDATYTGKSNLQIVSNAVRGTTLSTGNIESYNGTLPNDQWAQVTYTTYTAGLSGYGVFVRMTAPTTATWYSTDTDASNNWRILKSVAGVETTVATSTTTAASGQVIRLEVSGSTVARLILYVNGTNILDTTDASSPLTSGRAGLGVWVVTALGNSVLDDFSCGDNGPYQAALVQTASTMIGRRYV